VQNLLAPPAEIRASFTRPSRMTTRPSAGVPSAKITPPRGLARTRQREASTRSSPADSARKEGISRSPASLTDVTSVMDAPCGAPQSAEG
jgi:hypothetical protein